MEKQSVKVSKHSYLLPKVWELFKMELMQKEMPPKVPSNLSITYTTNVTNFKMVTTVTIMGP